MRPFSPRPARGNTPASVLAAIVKNAPRAIGAVKPAVPKDVARLVYRCLAKTPVDRYQSAIDLRDDLEDARQALTSAAVPPEFLYFTWHPALFPPRAPGILGFPPGQAKLLRLRARSSVAARPNRQQS